MIRVASSGLALVFTVVAALSGCQAKQDGDAELAGDDGDEFGESGEDPCLHVDAVLELDSRELCTITPSGLVLYVDVFDALVIARIEADGLEPVASVESLGSCGALAHDEVGDRLWLLDGGYSDPLRLRALDGAGTLAWERELSPLLWPSLIAVERDVLVAGALEGPQLDFTVELQRVDEAGETVWTRSGYVEASSDPNRAMSNLASPVLLGPDVAYLGSQWGIDSAAVTLLSIAPQDGALRWAELLTPDDYEGPRYALGGDGQRLLLNVTREPLVPDPFDPATTDIRAYSQAGEPAWTIEHAWSALYQLSVTATVRGGEDLVLATQAAIDDDPDMQTTRVAQYSQAGALECMFGLDGLALESVGALVGIPGDRVCLAGVGPIETVSGSVEGTLLVLMK